MRFEAARQGRRKRLSLTPVIDVVFLLLLFFMLASTFSRFAHVEIGIAGRMSGTPTPNDSPIILLSVSDGGAFSVNGEQTDLADIGQRLIDASSDGKARIVVRPSASAKAEHIVGAIEQSQAAKLGPVLLAR